MSKRVRSAVSQKTDCKHDGDEQVGNDVYAWPGGYTVDIRCADCDALIYRELHEGDAD
jgi:hypothetical protein